MQRFPAYVSSLALLIIGIDIGIHASALTSPAHVVAMIAASAAIVGSLIAIFNLSR